MQAMQCFAYEMICLCIVGLIASGWSRDNPSRVSRPPDILNLQHNEPVTSAQFSTHTGPDQPPSKPCNRP